MKRLFIAQAVALASMAFAFAPDASAHYPYSKQECDAFASVVKLVAERRDAGASADSQKEAIVKAVANVGPADSFIKDTKDMDAILRAVDIVFENEGMAPGELEQSVKASCYENATDKSRKTGATT